MGDESSAYRKGEHIYVTTSDDLLTVPAACQTCETAKTATHAISPVDDVASFSQAINLDVFMEEPLPYENYHVGVSYSLIFGVSLSEYSASNDGVLIP